MCACVSVCTGHSNTKSYTARDKVCRQANQPTNQRASQPKKLANVKAIVAVIMQCQKWQHKVPHIAQVCCGRINILCGSVGIYIINSKQTWWCICSLAANKHIADVCVLTLASSLRLVNLTNRLYACIIV